MGKKKVILIALLAAVVLAVSIGGVVLAQEATTTSSGNTLLARVAAILGIDQQKVEDAFNQARREQQSEALTNRLKALVEAGKITQAQADQYKAWAESRPDVPIAPGFGGRGGFGGMRGFGGGCGFQGLPGTVAPQTAN